MIIDLHTHTWPYSEDSDLKPHELIDLARSSGLDGVCFMEHDWHWEDEDIARLSREHSFPVFHGMEISSEEGHLLVYGLGKYQFGMHHAAFIRQLADDSGGAIIMAHPYRSRVRFNSDPDGLLESAIENSVFDLVDAVEVFNGRSKDEENRFAVEIGRRLNLRGVGGSDGHAPQDVPSFATEFEREVRSTEELITELKAGRFKPVDLRRS